METKLQNKSLASTTIVPKVLPYLDYDSKKDSGLEKVFSDNDKQYKLLADLSPEAIVVHSQGKIVYANRSAAKLVRAKSPKQIVGASILKFVHPDYLEIVKQRTEHVYNLKRPVGIIEEKLITLKDDIIDVEVISIPIIFQGKSSAQVILKDITEKKKIEKRQNFLELISNNLYTSFDKDLTLQKIAKLIVPEVADYCRIVVVDEESQVKELTIDHKDPTQVKLVSNLFDAYKDKTDLTYGVPKILKTGKPEIIEVIDEKIMQTIKDDKKLSKILKDIGLKSYMGVPLIARGKIIGAITFSLIRSGYFYRQDDLKFAMEIGRRVAIALDNANLYKQSQEKIRELKTMENNLRFLAEASKVLSSSLDYQTTLNSVANLAVSEMCNWCVIDLLNETDEVQTVALANKEPKKAEWAKLYRKNHPVNRDAKFGVAEVLRTGASKLYSEFTEQILEKAVKETKTLKIIKSLKIKSVMLVPLLIRDTPMGVISFISTDPKYRYSERDLYVAEKLANRAALAIENAKLYKNAQDAIALRDDFISVASHELKTPITSVKIYAQTLTQYAKQLENSRFLEYTTKMDKQLDRLTDLIHNLLNVSKIQSGRFEINKKLIDFNKVVQETIDILQGTITTHKIIIKGQTDKKVFADEDRIGQVLFNLISNAIKYSPKSNKVVVSLKEDENGVTVGVKDFGIGIDQKHKERIFDRFYRVFEKQDKTFPGLGIGLYVCKNIIQRHNGSIWVESQEGKGSTFYFSIPSK